jgi:hypothetical protein
MSRTTRKQNVTKPTVKRATEKAIRQPRKQPRAASKQARLIEMLRRAEGATIEEIVKALDWQAHTVRGAISGTLRRKLELTINSEKDDDRGRIYRITG